MKIKWCAVALLAVILSLSVVACGTTNQLSASIQLSVFIEGQGSVSPDGGAFTIGETVELMAIPESGWYFDHWEGDISGSENPTTIIMDSNKVVTAYFLEYGTVDGEETGILDGNSIEDATSLQFVVDATPVDERTQDLAYSMRIMFRITDIGSDGMKLRIDILNKEIDSQFAEVKREVGHFRILFDQSQQKALMANVGHHIYSECDDYNSIDWQGQPMEEETSNFYFYLVKDLKDINREEPPYGTIDVLSSYYFEEWVTAFNRHRSDLSQWTGGTWTSPDGLVKIHDILINPDFSDSIFTTEEVRGDEAPSTSGTQAFELTISDIEIRWGQDLLNEPSTYPDYSWPVINFNYSTNVPAYVVLVPPEGRWYSEFGYGIRNTLAELTDNFEFDFKQTGSAIVNMNYESDIAPLPGTYKMMAYSLIDGTKIWEENLTFSAPEISIKSADVKYWEWFWSYPVAQYWPKLVAIEITNKGDLPAYGYYVRAWVDEVPFHVMDGPDIIWIGTPEIIWENSFISESLIEQMQDTSYTKVDSGTYFEGQGVFNTDGFGGNAIVGECEWDEVQQTAFDAPETHDLYIELVDYDEEAGNCILVATYSTTIQTPGF